MATKSLLLSLPQEIKDQILLRLLGKRNIHIGYNDGTEQPWKATPPPKEGFFYFLCRGEAEPYATVFPSSHPASGPPRPAIWRSGYRNRSTFWHRNACFSPLELNDDPKLARIFRERLALPVLLVCREMHDAATPILYGSNHFYFEDYRRSSDLPPSLQAGPRGAFCRFTASLSRHQRSLVRRLHVCSSGSPFASTTPLIDLFWKTPVARRSTMGDRQGKRIQQYENLRAISIDHLLGTFEIWQLGSLLRPNAVPRLRNADAPAYGRLAGLLGRTELRITIWYGAEWVGRLVRGWEAQVRVPSWKRVGNKGLEERFRTMLLGIEEADDMEKDQDAGGKVRRIA